MELKGCELAAVVKLAKAMVYADGKVDQNEITAMSLNAMKFGVSGEALKSILALAESMEYSSAIGFVSLMDTEKKKYVTSFLAVVMAADGEIAASELNLWKMISTLAELPEMPLDEALEFWINH